MLFRPATRRSFCRKWSSVQRTVTQCLTRMNELVNNPVRAAASCLAGMAREDPPIEACRTERKNFVKFSCLYQLHHQSCNGASCINIGAQLYGNVFYGQVGNWFRCCTRRIGIYFPNTHRRKAPVHKIPYCFRSRVAEYVKPSRLIRRLTKLCCNLYTWSRHPYIVQNEPTISQEVSSI